MKIDITPDPAIDLTRLGVCKVFDTKVKPGFVMCYFEDGQEMKLSHENFDRCRFLIDEDAKGNDNLLRMHAHKFSNDKHFVRVR